MDSMCAVDTGYLPPIRHERGKAGSGNHRRTHGIAGKVLQLLVSERVGDLVGDRDALTGVCTQSSGKR